MEYIRFDGAVANIEIEISIINYLSTPSKLQWNVHNFNDFNGSTNSKVASQNNDYHIKKLKVTLKKN